MGGAGSWRWDDADRVMYDAKKHVQNRDDASAVFFRKTLPIFSNTGITLGKTPKITSDESLQNRGPFKRMFQKQTVIEVK